jgi:hypothetical protein
MKKSSLSKENFLLTLNGDRTVTEPTSTRSKNAKFSNFSNTYLTTETSQLNSYYLETEISKSNTSLMKQKIHDFKLEVENGPPNHGANRSRNRGDSKTFKDIFHDFKTLKLENKKNVNNATTLNSKLIKKTIDTRYK